MQVGESFTNAPLQLRERVADRLNAFYKAQGEPTTFEDRSRRMHHHMRKAMVHLAAARRYEEYESLNQTAREYYARRERESAEAEFKEAIRLGDLLAAEDPGDHRVTRDQIVSHIRLSALSAQLDHQDAAKEHLRTAREMLEALIRSGPFSRIQWTDWMDLPNLEAAEGDRALERGDKDAARNLYEKALTLQKELVDRRPWDKEREDELEEIRKHIEEISE